MFYYLVIANPVNHTIIDVDKKKVVKRIEAPRPRPPKKQPLPPGKYNDYKDKLNLTKWKFPHGF
jgi:hypothetical protein